MSRSLKKGPYVFERLLKKVEELYVKEARVDAGPVMKRHMFDSRSHIGHNDKRTSHIVITVASR